MSGLPRHSGMYQVDGDKVYFVNQAGEPYRVYDGFYGPPENQPFRRSGYRPPHPGARQRYFVARDGTQRVHDFVPDEDRRLNVESLARQLAGASYLETRRFDPTQHYTPSGRPHPPERPRTTELR